MTTARAHVVLPQKLIDEIDEIAGKRKRSQFVEDAIRTKLRREAQSRAIRDTVGMLSAEDYPEWSTPEKSAAWVRKIREEADRSTDDARSERAH
jgi:metal-responsive CopG/Arc/MetJ family transcriptional regulator